MGILSKKQVAMGGKMNIEFHQIVEKACGSHGFMHQARTPRGIGNWTMTGIWVNDQGRLIVQQVLWGWRAK